MQFLKSDLQTYDDNHDIDLKVDGSRVALDTKYSTIKMS